VVIHLKVRECLREFISLSLTYGIDEQIPEYITCQPGIWEGFGVPSSFCFDAVIKRKNLKFPELAKYVDRWNAT